MKVLFVFYVPSGGVETLNRQRAAALKKKNIQCDFLYFENKRDTINHHDGNVFIAKKDDEIQKILLAGNYQAVIVISDFYSLSKYREWGYKGALVLEIQGLGSKEGARDFFVMASHSIQNYADGLLTPCTPHIDRLIEEFFPNKKKFSFNNCFDSEKFSYRQIKKAKGPIIGWVGRLEENKNWTEFIEIGNKLVKANKDLLLFMFEDPSLSTPQERVRFQQKVIDYRLSDQLVTLQNIPNHQMADYYSIIGDSGGFLCSTSKVEGAPYSILEAMSCRCPILTTDSDGVRSSVIHNYTGKYYAIGNIEDAIKEGTELMNNLPLREQIRENGVKHLKENFSLEKYAENFEKMLKDLGVG